jgi:hypothetical protein
MGAVAIEGESLVVVGLNRKAADELPSAMPAGESAPAHSFELLTGKLKVGTLMKVGNFALNGGEINLIKVGTVTSSPARTP